MNAHIKYLFSGVVSLVLLVFASCSQLRKVKTEYIPPEEIRNLDRDIPFLQAHMKNGDLYVLQQWAVSEEDSTISGSGKYYNVNREMVSEGDFRIRIGDVQLIESNTYVPSIGATGLLVMTGISLTLTAYCAFNPKACFGSCPTFYVNTGQGETLLAEGFSSSIAASLEEDDLDALYTAKPVDSSFEIRVTNEALETHNIRYAELLAFPRKPGERVFATRDGSFFTSGHLAAPRVRDENGNIITSSIRSFDNRFYSSKSDPDYLAAREHLLLELPLDEGDDTPKGLVISARQTLMSTFLFYQVLSYLGRSAGYFMAELDRRGQEYSRRFAGINDLLGSIELQYQRPGGTWETAGAFNETGPLATDTKVIILPETVTADTPVRLRLTKGHWRIDYLALADLGKHVQPVRIKPEVRNRSGRFDAGITSMLNDTNRYLTTLPGDEYTLVYPVPADHASYEYFLHSKGYYLEWMREEWMEEENLDKAFTMLTQPEKMLRELAPVYKKMESGMEEIFWRSRYVKK